ncbi:MAG: hypothetical protein GWM90_17725, partial [Gemmatimonadetes bacterium]|nr:SURF1 family protein [Gemmatimonadota bacterium]NIQ56189.1 SURF1 family protein [Gemmatimonadota bacterium]NIU76383.1 hypothetical protein [Gammaproteobacteria bacterium]NIX45864.1 hypothetical protein [Gemmatimonadota bacterium]NIY10170.1 hypothetical protein [Gemmatimonadota bacterium]
LERNRAVAERLDSGPISLRGAPADTGGLSYRRVRMEGDLDRDRIVLLAGRSRGGAPGVHVLAPLRAADGAILVNLGWLPAPDAATVDPAALPGDGRFRVEGVLLPFPDVDLDARPDTFRTTWFRLDGEAVRAQFPYRIAPLYVRATDRPTPADAPARDLGGQSEPSGPAGPVPLDPP